MVLSSGVDRRGRVAFYMLLVLFSMRVWESNLVRMFGVVHFRDAWI